MVMKDKPIILVVDDEPANRQVLAAMLVPMGYQVVFGSNGNECIAQVKETPPDLILMDVRMPEMDGITACQILKSNPSTMPIPIVIITGLRGGPEKMKALEAGVDDFLNKPVDLTELQARVKSLLRVKAYNDLMMDYQAQLESEVAKRTDELSQALEKIKLASLDTIYRLSKAVEFRDRETGMHIIRMSQYAVAIATQLNLDQDTIEGLLYAAPMHDIGKIGVPDRILLKEGPLDENEIKAMRKHTKMGANIMENSDFPYIQMAAQIALTHHEKWDGTGYPRGLKGEAIPLVGRIVALADYYDTLTSHRSYKEAYSTERSIQMILELKGTHFDPQVVDAFMQIQDRVQEINEMYKAIERAEQDDTVTF